MKGFWERWIDRLCGRRPWGATLVAGLAALVLYAPSLRFPLIYDSLLHIRMVKQLDLASAWLPVKAFGFYRPLTFVPLLLIRQLFDAYPAWLLHGLNVLQHALNVVLLVALAWRLWRERSTALTAGLLFALYPFSYQAIAVYGHNVHPTTVGLVLLGLHAYLSAVERRDWRWWLATGVVFLLGLLSHETAVLFGPLAALVQWNINERTPQVQPQGLPARYPWLAFLLTGGLYAVGYRLLPLTRDLPGWGDGGGWLALLYLLQSAAYPFCWFAHLLPGLNAAVVVLGAFALSLGWTAWSALTGRSRPGRGLLLGWGWWGMASALLALSLPGSYLLHGPRLLYFGSVGLALLWALLLNRLRSLPAAGRLLWGVALVAILLSGGRFVGGRLDQYAQLTAPVALAQEVMENRPEDEGVLLVNTPEYLSPARNTFAVGAEMVSMLPDYLSAGELIRVNLKTDRPVMAIQLPELLGDAGYPYAVAGNTDLSRGSRRVLISPG